MFTRNSLTIRFWGSAFLSVAFVTLPCIPLKAKEPSSDQVHFQSKSGFKPAQANFQSIFLQMAGSFEHFGSPEPFIRHVLAENRRIDEKCKKEAGNAVSALPDYFTDEQAEIMIRKWKQMAPILSLEILTRQSGANMRHAIMGSWNMTYLELAALETNLSTAERGAYSGFLKKAWFTRADFVALEAFYEGSFDKLTEVGKNQMSKRRRLGEMPAEKRTASIAEEKGGTILLALLGEHQRNSIAYLQDRTAPRADASTLQERLVSRLELNTDGGIPAQSPETERDALFYAELIRDAVRKRIAHVRRQAQQPKQADDIENALHSMIGVLAVLAQSEFEAAVREEAVDRKSKSN